MRVAALVLGAGRGERLGREVPKAFVPLAGRPLLVHSVETLCSCAEVDWVLPVLPADRLAEAEHLLPAHPKRLPAVAGGATRQGSVRAGLEALPDDVGVIAVHDAARPRLRAAAVSRVVAVAVEHGAALLATPLTDTIKRGRDGLVVETPDRTECFAAQTPQAFRVDWLRQGLEKALAEGRDSTDCSQLIEALGHPVHLVPGDADNWKITDAADLARAARELAS